MAASGEKRFDRFLDIGCARLHIDNCLRTSKSNSAKVFVVGGEPNEIEFGLNLRNLYQLSTLVVDQTKPVDFYRTQPSSFDARQIDSHRAYASVAIDCRND